MHFGLYSLLLNVDGTAASNKLCLPNCCFLLVLLMSWANLRTINVYTSTATGKWSYFIIIEDTLFLILKGLNTNLSCHVYWFHLQVHNLNYFMWYFTVSVHFKNRLFWYLKFYIF